MKVYVNGCSIAVNRELNEIVLTFMQTAPAFDEEEMGFNGVKTEEVQSLVMTYDGFESMVSAMNEVIEQAEKTEDE